MIKTIDKELAIYYRQHHRDNYYDDESGLGVFEKFCQDNGFQDDDAIKDELNLNDPSQSQFDIDDFPFPKIMIYDKNTFIYHILLKCKNGDFTNHEKANKEMMEKLKIKNKSMVKLNTVVESKQNGKIEYPLGVDLKDHNNEMVDIALKFYQKYNIYKTSFDQDKFVDECEKTFREYGGYGGVMGKFNKVKKLCYSIKYIGPFVCDIDTCIISKRHYRNPHDDIVEYHKNPEKYEAENSNFEFTKWMRQLDEIHVFGLHQWDTTYQCAPHRRKYY